VENDTPALALDGFKRLLNVFPNTSKFLSKDF
jgi:hypothetical protein